MRFAGHIFEPLPSGGLYWHAQKTLLVADLHLEKMSSFAQRGQMLPPYDTGLTLTQLEADLRRTQAQRLVALGDSFHRDEGTTTLTDHDRSRLGQMVISTEWLWLSGNHDPHPHALGGRCLNLLDLAGLTLTHEPRRGVLGLVAGHLHPSARLFIDGRSTRRPCFVHDNRLLILPAYGASTGSINILSKPFAELFDWDALDVTMLGKWRTYPVSPRRLIRG
ncbi:MAG TPA: ligase-associated DNA damage response endonuclease PdeM [Devosia sp.]|nr:ligase-associated DNA damage response endonuclease PdeM [Devosia sp.]